MEKRKYSKPVVTVEKFEPQEYCEVCASPGNERKDFPGSAFVDFNDDGHCQANESVSNSGQTSYPVEGRYTIDVYQFQSNKFGWSEAWGLFSEALGHEYGSTWSWIYRLHKVSGSYKVILKNGQVYYNLS